MICVIVHPKILRSLGPLGPLLLWWFQKLLFITASQCDPRWPMAPNRGCENAVQTKVGSQTGQSPGWKSVEIGGENLWKSAKSVAFLIRPNLLIQTRKSDPLWLSYSFFLDPIQTGLFRLMFPVSSGLGWSEWRPLGAKKEPWRLRWLGSVGQPWPLFLQQAKCCHWTALRLFVYDYYGIIMG